MSRWRKRGNQIILINNKMALQIMWAELEAEQYLTAIMNKYNNVDFLVNTNFIFLGFVIT